MKIVGRVLITEGQGRQLTAGGTFDVPAGQFRQNIAGVFGIGDLAWVQEPYFAVMPKSLAYASGVLVGPHGRSRNRMPKRMNLERSKLARETGKYLRRVDSCVTLEVMGIVEGAVRCLTHFEQVDVFIKSQGAKR
jgi:hypothetical protein